MNQIFGVPPAGVQQLLFVGRDLNFQLTTDQALTKVHDGGRYKVTQVVAAQKSGAFNTACAGGLYTAASKGGSALVAAGQSYANLTATNKIVDATVAAVNTTDAQSAAQLFVSLTTGNGAALTADVYVFGVILD